MFEIKKFDFSQKQEDIISFGENITVREEDYGFNIAFEIDITDSEILAKLNNKKNIKVCENTIHYSSYCYNNEIVVGVYSLVERSSSSTDFIDKLERIVDTLNLWEIN